MECLEAIKKRRSIRSYKNKPIGKDILGKLMEAAGFAPTARNIQPWQFVAVTERAMLEKIGQLAENGRFVSTSAACIAVFCADTKYYLEDGCAATQNILLAATAEGIGSCWVAGDKKPYASRINALLDAPAGLKLVSLIALGYPEPAGSLSVSAHKKPLKEIVHWEKFPKPAKGY